MLNYWIKLIENKNSLMYKVYSMLCNDLNNGKTYNGHNWAFQIKSIIDDLGFSDIWLNQNVYTINISVLK